MQSICLSLIVPVYNAELYLRQTVNSLLSQGFSDNEYEIILVDDGSKDRSLSICKELSESHQNVRILTQTNQGVCAARNAGMAVAKGEWIGFVDADDLIVKDGYHYIFSTFPLEKYDVVRFFTKLVYNEEKESDNPQGQSIFEGAGISYVENFGLDTFAVGFLYRRKWLIEKEIVFEPGIVMGEDFLFCSDVLLNNPRVLSTSCKIYNYIIRQSSATTTRNYQHIRKCVESQIYAFERIYEIYRTIDNAEQSERCFYRVHSTIQGRCSHLFSRLLTSDYSIAEFKVICSRLNKSSILPLPYHINGNLNKNGIFINSLYSFPWLYPFLKLCYSKFFMTLIYPRIKRI